ncbi:hypothetical protein [Candidatus Palauibacter sp.]|uniref:hypothetical protein n=1 Tax=Candidatus Palauibacter sp. TaxID=3101350 RepID=UPI003B022F94
MAIADWGLAEVIVVNPDGEWQGAVMTRGEGPGEVQAPLTWVDANTLLVLDFGVYRLTTLDLASRSACVTAVDPAFLSPVFMSGEATFVAVQPDQTVWLGSCPEPGGRYELEVFDRDGTTLVRFCHPGEAFPLSPAERGEDAGEDTDEGMPDAWRSVLREVGESPEPAIISRIVVDADRRIWVQRDRPLPGAGNTHGASGAMYDVFLPSGRFLGSIRLPDDQRLLEARGRRVWTLHTGSFDEPSIVALEIEGF